MWRVRTLTAAGGVSTWGGRAMSSVRTAFHQHQVHLQESTLQASPAKRAMLSVKVSSWRCWRNK